MNMRLQASSVIALLGLAAVALAPQAQACGLNLVKAAGGRWTIAPPAKMTVTATHRAFLAATLPVSGAAAMRNPLQFLAPIAGLYEVHLTAEGNGPTGVPDGAPVDHAYQAWHADGTEIMNSGRPAADSNFCLGTWAKTGARTYQLNHFMLSWVQSLDADGIDIDNTFVGPANIQETVTLSPDGNSFTGTFVLTQYDTNYNIILPGGIPIKGTVAGMRKTVNSPVTY